MKLKTFLNYLITLVVINAVNAEPADTNLIVELSLGKLQGKDRGFYYSYESIPYAKAPVGELRFEAPQPYDDKWNDIFDATKTPVNCIQWNQLNECENKLEGSEDCLFVHVYKPKTGKAKYPVVAYLHGGAFMFGGANDYSEDILMESGETILVKISYRLGPMGFLSTEDEHISGNYGLKDQQLALKWIKDNIQYFNGDPEKVLLLGFSAGAGSVHLQMLNSNLQGTVKAAVSVSGAILSPWGIMNDPKEKALRMAELLQCPDLTNTNAIKHCLKQKPAAEIVTNVKEIFNWGYNPVVAFGPVVEPKNAPQPFMTEHPRDIIKSGNFSHIPWLVSHTKDDGGYNAAEMMQINPKTEQPYINGFKDKWLELAPENLFLENIHDDPKKYAQELLDHYLGNLTFSEENYMKIQQLHTDVFFINGIKETLKLHSHYSTAPIYAYVYDNPADYTLGNLLANRTDIQFGTVHGDDFSLMMSFPLHRLRPDEEVISQKFIKMLEDFVKDENLKFGDCVFEDNHGDPHADKFLLISRNSCKNIRQ